MSAKFIKQGAVFKPGVMQWLENDGITPIPLTGKTVTSKINNKDKDFTVTLTVTILDAAQGRFSITPVSTSTWPLGYLFWDASITTTGSGLPDYTDTIILEIGRSES